MKNDSISQTIRRTDTFFAVYDDRIVGMIGLKRGSVELLSHQEEWDKNAENVVLKLKQLFGNAAVDIQHVGSTAIASIYAKPIIDIVIGLRNLNDISPYIKRLEEHGFVFRGEDVAGQMLFVMGDFEKDTRTHHIHAVKWNGTGYLSWRTEGSGRHLNAGRSISFKNAVSNSAFRFSA